ncbi:hypothetical protein KFE25_012900 [Diacronema lutheri]|uniref:Uncharacterized protein n=1 Tax=Diacronema lutheri TaxID=2081491 RepID=A0A8J5XDL3_DIALT|nr:hypothetical protein KFE25_012900 [Diacronema lutheri]
MQPRSLLERFDESECDEASAELGFAAELACMTEALAHAYAEGELAVRSAVERHRHEIFEQDCYELALAELRTQGGDDALRVQILCASSFEAPRTLWTNEPEASAVRATPKLDEEAALVDVDGGTPRVPRSPHLTSPSSAADADKALAPWSQLEFERQERLAVQDILELRRAESNGVATRLRQADDERKRLTLALAAKKHLEAKFAIVESQLAHAVEQERASINSIVSHALAEQKAALEHGFKEKTEAAARQRAAREAHARQQQAHAASRGAPRGAVLALDLMHLAAKSALPAE